jgi:glutamate dehydrogenase (NADP+)
MKYASVHDFLTQVADRNPGQPEFLQAVTEVMESLWPFISTHPKYAEQGCWTAWSSPSGW